MEGREKLNNSPNITQVVAVLLRIKHGHAAHAINVTVSGE